MFLKSLTLRGFKSFASATTLKLGPGVTAVVGPNGSGKSNIVDALAWVMGEQGAKSLRGGTMSDVIFAGAGGRGALGRAEVSLTIDNSDGTLPVDYSEVSITRTMFRSGGSEYAINGNPARLLDVQELLSDTGLGKQMHVIVGQGRLDSVLSADAMDRRGFIEEAAGVLKHRRRKERALRKLESLDENTARVRDLVEELRRQLGPLSRQAAAARRAAAISEQVRWLRIYLISDRLREARLDLERAAHCVNDARAARSELQQQKLRLDELVGALEREIASIDPQVRAISERLERWRALAERASTISQVLDERARSLGSPSAPVVSMSQSLLREAGSVEAALLKDELGADDLRRVLADLATERLELQASRGELSAQVSALVAKRTSQVELIARAESQVDAAAVAVERAREHVEVTRHARMRSEQSLEKARHELEAFEAPELDGQKAAVREQQIADEQADVARATLDGILVRERDLSAQLAAVS